MYIWQPCGLGLLYVFNLELNGELFLTRRLVYRCFDCAPCSCEADPDNWHIGIYLQDLGLHFPALAC
jgi:hypothetical protein